MTTTEFAGFPIGFDAQGWTFRLKGDELRCEECNAVECGCKYLYDYAGCTCPEIKEFCTCKECDEGNCLCDFYEINDFKDRCDARDDQINSDPNCSYCNDYYCKCECYKRGVCSYCMDGPPQCICHIQNVETLVKAARDVV
jgi:hypothetical protein